MLKVGISAQTIITGKKRCGETLHGLPLTIGLSMLHTESLLSEEKDVTLILRTSSGEGKEGWKGDGESGPRDWGDSRVGEGGSKLRLWVESVLLWPLARCHWEKKKYNQDGIYSQTVFLRTYFRVSVGWVVVMNLSE